MVRYLAKFLLLIAVFIIAYMVIKSGARRREWPKQAPGSIAEEDMVRCKVCGVHLPRSESLESRDEYFCSEEHRRIARK
ncbi:MAG: preprotein translocase subunit YajC [Betaproteobacteria bacterium]|nr:MAG: preprotein translocase subunit YajC [Betaproteobacteria bacterium]